MFKLAQQTSNCTYNGEPVDCGELFEPVAAFLTALGIFLSAIGVIFLVSLIFWILSLIHLFSNEDVDERIVWIFLVLFVPFLQFIYFFGPRRSYEKRKMNRSNLAHNKQKQ